MASGSSLRGLVLLLITSGFFVAGLLFDYMPMIIDEHIKRNIELATNEEIRGLWSKPPVDVQSYYWLYDILNPEQFQLAGERVRVRKVGPFHFVSRFEKRQLDLSPNKFRLTYNATRYTFLNESYSPELLDEPLHLLNPTLATIIEVSRVHGQAMDAQTRRIAAGSVSKIADRFNETLIHNVTARLALLGKPMPIIEQLKKLARTFGVESDIPDLAPGGQYGYATATNASWQGPFEIYTGYRESARSLGDIISYKGKRRLDYYEGKCNRLQASAGELRPMPVEPGQVLEIFAPRFCRIVHLRPTGQLKLREGVAYNYQFASEDFLSAEQNPDNRCFCTDASPDDNHCSLNGVIELAPCSYGAPMLLTSNSLQLDPKITSTIANWEPEMFHSDVEQLAPANSKAQFVVLRRIGLPLRADITITLLIKVIRDPTFKQTANVPEVSYIPLATVRESVMIPERFAKIIVNLESFLTLAYHLKVVLYLSAIVLLCWLTGHHYCRTSSSSTQSGRRSSGAPAALRRPSAAVGGSGGANGLELGNSLNGSGPRGGAANAAAGAGAGQTGTDDTGGGGDGGDGGGATSEAPGLLGANRVQRNIRQAQTVEERIGQAARTNDSASGERANSGDSSRSLPPSRQASRLGSLDEPADSAAPVEPVQPAVQQQPQSGGRPSQGQAVSTQPAQVSRIFSQVDAQLAEKSSKGRGSLEAAGSHWATVAPVESAQQRQELINGDAEGPAKSAEGSAEGPAGGLRRRRKGWLMSVYSRFVGMLSGIRSSIQSVGQLDISEDDQQDRQLEMLAGRIDNWFSGSTPDASQSGPSGEPDQNKPSGGGGGGGEAAGEGAPGAGLWQANERATDGSAQTAGGGGGEQAAGGGPKSRRPLVSRSSAAATEASSGGGGEPAASGQEAQLDAVERLGSAGGRKMGDDEPAPGSKMSEVSGPDESAAAAAVRRKRSADGGPAESGEPEESEESEEEAEGPEAERCRQQSEEDKANTLKRIEAALEAGNGRPADGPADLATLERASARRQVTMINSSTSIDSQVINSTAIERPAVSALAAAAAAAADEFGSSAEGSSLDSRVTQVAATPISGPADEARRAPNQSSGAEAAPARLGQQQQQQQIDGSSGRLERQFDKWAAEARGEQDAIKRLDGRASGAGADLERQPSGGCEGGGGGGGGEGQCEGVGGGADGRATSGPEPLESSGAKGAGGRDDAEAEAEAEPEPEPEPEPDQNAAQAHFRDNGQAASKLDARNGISGAAGRRDADRAAASSLSGDADDAGRLEPEARDKIPSARVNGKLEANSAAPAKVVGRPGSEQNGSAAELLEAGFARRAGGGGSGSGSGGGAKPRLPSAQTGQVNGLVAAAGQPINVGSAPTTKTQSLNGANSAQGGRSCATHLLLPNGNSHQPASPLSSSGHGNNIAPMTFRRKQPRAGSSRSVAGADDATAAAAAAAAAAASAVDGNNILNEKIMSHQRQGLEAGAEARRLQRQQQRSGAAAARIAAAGLKSNQHSANETTGNHQWVQPAGV